MLSQILTGLKDIKNFGISNKLNNKLDGYRKRWQESYFLKRKYYFTRKTLVGLNESESEFSTVNKIGGEKTHTLTINEMPSHNHDFRYSTDNAVTFYNAGVGKDGTYTGDNYLGFSNSVSLYLSKTDV